MQKTQVTEWLAPGIAADALGVTPKSVARLADAGEIRFVRLPSGHRRYAASDVSALLARTADWSRS